MKTKEWHTVDKSAWQPGPWKIEPDKLQFQDEKTGLPCLILRNQHGTLCGYVGVYVGHPFFSRKYNECSLLEAKRRGKRDIDDRLLAGDSSGGIKLHPVPKEWIELRQNMLVCGDDDYCDHSAQHLLDAHGGITFSGFCWDGPNPEAHICHEPDLGEDKKVWWLGFDCSHSGDLSPAYTTKEYERLLGKKSCLADGTYKNIRYVKAEIKSLAHQLKAIECRGKI